ncbi:hypothetical protein [Sediminimonas qiaohouensis]|uniref:hypothetical protein n=1 Tax=Sediminimonas qiaohouensis TaxID=552061 RepID=UPI00047997F6|nr:hypothetical protein [Sediminimonas qiaohouensis]
MTLRRPKSNGALPVLFALVLAALMAVAPALGASMSNERADHGHAAQSSAALKAFAEPAPQPHCHPDVYCYLAAVEPLAPPRIVFGPMDAKRQRPPDSVSRGRSMAPRYPPPRMA